MSTPKCFAGSLLRFCFKRSPEAGRFLEGRRRGRRRFAGRGGGTCKKGRGVRVRLLLGKRNQTRSLRSACPGGSIHEEDCTWDLHSFGIYAEPHNAGVHCVGSAERFSREAPAGARQSSEGTRGAKVWDEVGSARP